MLILPITYKDNIDFYKKYLSIFQGELNLTERESTILVNLINKYLLLLENNNEDIANTLLFESKSIISFCKENNLSIQQYHNIKNALIDKKALFKLKDNSLLVNKLLIPKQEIGFKFTKNGR